MPHIHDDALQNYEVVVEKDEDDERLRVFSVHMLPGDNSVRVPQEFLEAGKKRLAGDTARAATTDEVKGLRREARDLKECVADLTIENRLLKKSMIADGDDDA